VIRLLLDTDQVERAKRILGTRLSLSPPTEDQRASAKLKCHSFEDVRQLLAFGNAVTILDPPAARARLKELALQIYQHYD
jgi:WYL domain